LTCAISRRTFLIWCVLGQLTRALLHAQAELLTRKIEQVGLKFGGRLRLELLEFH
jgi:hypothetical protein